MEESIIIKKAIEPLTDEQIEHWAKQWKKALGINPYRLEADKDFQAGAHAVINFIKEQNKL